MDDFGVFVVFGINEAPRKLLCTNGSAFKCVAVPDDSQQVVLFSSGRWGERICVNAELNDANRVPITIGKLTPYNKCLSWERCEEESWREGAMLTITLEGGDLVRADLSEAAVTLAMKEFTPEGSGAPPAVREGKRRREDEDENMCPNDDSPQRSTPLRRVKGHGKGSQTRLFQQGGATRTPQNPPRGRGRQAKTPTQTASLAGPSGRWGQSMCLIDPQTAILIGGQGCRMQFCKDPMWKLCTEDMSWVAAETLAEGPTPEARIGHTATYDPDSRRIFVFGGSKNRKWFNDVHILDTQSWRWSTVEAQGKVPPLAYHSCSMFRGELFVLGGVFPRPHPEPDGCSDSLYIFDPQLSIWYQPIVMGDKPAPRSGHSACVLGGKIFMFGGWDTPVCYNDMYMLDLGLMEFSAVRTSGRAPSPRCWHGNAPLSGSRFLLHGGYDGHHALTDTFIFNTETSSWTEVFHPQLSVPRAGHSIITMTTANRLSGEGGGEEGGASKTLLVFGGGDNEGNFYSDLTTVAEHEMMDKS
ncbi:kelch repeat-containing protein [Hypomesus transpacificus]|uniref:kelch repeat-containing protein n=1 Tax=Hypomesus transpacificus TaxID=137520 RepID=UPI001F07CBD8|nr:kelch repeat-containing protein [Hypomesus transpacificus]